MTEQPLTFRTKSQLLLNSSELPNAELQLLPDNSGVEPSTCVDAEPYALQVLDDSMAPEFWPGCIILIDPTGRATDGSYVLAKSDEANSESDAQGVVEMGRDGGADPYVFRQLRRHGDGHWTLDALSENYPAIATDKQLHNIVGVIVQRAGKRRHQHKRYD